MDKYFELYDGQAVTTEDFVHAMELASGKDLTQFKNWYSRPGTPTLKITSTYEQKELRLKIDQIYPPTTLKVPEGNILHMPLKLAFLFEDGTVKEEQIEINKLSQTVTFPMQQTPVLSLNRSFSAPVHVDYPYELSDLLRLMGHDTDAYCRYEATQKVYDHIFKTELNHFQTSGQLTEALSGDFLSAFEQLLRDEKIDRSFKSHLLDLPSENTIAQEILAPDFQAIHLVHKHLQKKIGLAFQGWFLEEHERLSQPRKFELTPDGYGQRALKNQVLSYLVASETTLGHDRLQRHYQTAANMTEEIFSLIQFVKMGAKLEDAPVKAFYQKWKHDSLVMLKWFGALASYSPALEAIERLHRLEKDPLFQKDVPNYLRALYVQFARNNLVGFHSADGRGYQFMSDKIIEIDKFNPQVASRAASLFSLINRLDDVRKTHMKDALNRVMESGPSRDTFEVVSKYLAQ
jgi:aminopeptidase N